MFRYVLYGNSSTGVFVLISSDSTGDLILQNSISWIPDSFFAVEIIGLLALDDNAISG